MIDAWTAPPVERAEAGLILGERQALEAWLDFHRATLLRKCVGLTAGQLKERAVPPSRLSLLGLVRHMTEVERGWFRMHAADTDLPFPYDPDQAGQDFEALDGADAAASIEAFRQEIERARAAVAGKRLDDVVPSHGHYPERARDIRWIYLHMIEEYARHNGRATSSRSGSTASPVTDARVGIAGAGRYFAELAIAEIAWQDRRACAGRIGPGQLQADRPVTYADARSQPPLRRRADRILAHGARTISSHRG